MKKYLLPLILILLLTFTLIGNCAWLSGYDQRIKLTIDNTKVDAALSDFPVTIFFRSTQGEEIFTEFDADSDYMKCAFTSSDGTTQLYAEKELFGIHKSQYPPAQSSTYVKSTTKYDTNYWAFYATNPAKSLTGTWSVNAWLSAAATHTNQRFHIDLGGAKIVTRIYYENAHSSGGTTKVGVQNFTFWGSNTGAGTFDDLVYANDEGWTQLTISQSTFDEHTASDVADPKYITVTNSTAYRYYAFKFADNRLGSGYMGVRRIELQIKEAIYHVKVTSVASGADTDIYYYYDNDHADNTTYIGAINTAAGATVWDNNFKAVYHMVDATTSTVVDSTSNNNDGTKKGANEPVEATGKVGQAQDFAGDDDYIMASHDVSISFDASNFTLEILTYCDDLAATEVILSKSTTTAEKPYRMFKSDDDLHLDYEVGDASEQRVTVANVLLSGWQYIAGTYIESSKNLALYLNGAYQDDITGSYSVADNLDERLTIGANWDDTASAYGLPFEGKIDEVRISSTNRVAAWIKATCNSLWDTLLTYGSEEASEEDNAIFFGMNF